MPSTDGRSTRSNPQAGSDLSRVESRLADRARGRIVSGASGSLLMAGETTAGRLDPLAGSSEELPQRVKGRRLQASALLADRTVLRIKPSLGFPNDHEVRVSDRAFLHRVRMSDAVSDFDSIEECLPARGLSVRFERHVCDSRRQTQRKQRVPANPQELGLGDRLTVVIQSVGLFRSERQLRWREPKLAGERKGSLLRQGG